MVSTEQRNISTGRELQGWRRKRAKVCLAWSHCYLLFPESLLTSESLRLIRTLILITVSQTTKLKVYTSFLLKRPPVTDFDYWFKATNVTKASSSDRWIRWLINTMLLLSHCYTFHVSHVFQNVSLPLTFCITQSSSQSHSSLSFPHDEYIFFPKTLLSVNQQFSFYLHVKAIFDPHPS